MTIERSHGKARPTLPRASDLGPRVAEVKPTVGRGPGGLFAAGNRIGVEARSKRATTLVLGSKADAGEAGIVARDARRIFGGYMRSLGSDAPPVRAMAALASRHAALAAFYAAKAVAAGLDTPQGMKLQEASDKQSQRAERTLVTAEDLADRHSKADKLNVSRSVPWMAPAADVQPDTDTQEDT